MTRCCKVGITSSGSGGDKVNLRTTVRAMASRRIIIANPAINKLSSCWLYILGMMLEASSKDPLHGPLGQGAQVFLEAADGLPHPTIGD